MNIKIHSRFLFLVNISLVSMLLASCAVPAVRTLEVEANPFNQFAGELEIQREQIKIPGITVDESPRVIVRSVDGEGAVLIKSGDSLLSSYSQHWLWGSP